MKCRISFKFIINSYIISSSHIIFLFLRSRVEFSHLTRNASRIPETECLHTTFTLPTPLNAGYSVKLLNIFIQFFKFIEYHICATAASGLIVGSIAAGTRELPRYIIYGDVGRLIRSLHNVQTVSESLTIPVINTCRSRQFSVFGTVVNNSGFRCLHEQK